MDLDWGAAEFSVSRAMNLLHQAKGWRLYQPFLSQMLSLGHWPSTEEFNNTLDDGHLLKTSGIVFGQQQKVPSRRRREVLRLSYETYIFEQGFIPTRLQNWHDFFNAAVWASLPQAKLALSRAQRAAQCERAAAAVARRSPLEDCLTMFDEGGMIAIAPEAQVDVLQKAAADVKETDKIAVFRQANAELYLFGHGIMEGQIKGDHGTRAICFVLAQPDGDPTEDFCSWRTVLDRKLAQFISEIGSGIRGHRNFGGYPVDAIM